MVSLQSVPDASGFAEVKTLIEPPFIYLYHTLRYFARNRDENDRWIVEDLATQVLSMNPTFRISMPLMQVDSVAAGSTTTLDQCLPIGMQNVQSCALTVECAFGKQAKSGLRLHIRSSFDGRSWDTRDMETFEIKGDGGAEIRETLALEPKCRFFKVLCENLDGNAGASDLRITATLGR